MITIGVITTNHHKRFKILEKTIDSINKNTDINDKIMSIDEFTDIETDHDNFEKYKNTDWHLTYKRHSGRNSMVTNQINLLNNVQTEWILYCEDDVTFKKIPSLETLKKILNKDTGFISFNAHVHQFPKQEVYDYCFDDKNYEKIDDIFLFKKNENIFQTMWFFNFPSCIVRIEHLKKCLNYASNNFSKSSYSIEEGLSYSWLKLYQNTGYNNYIILQNKPSQNETHVLKKIHDLSIMNYWDNDASTRVESVNNKNSMWF